MALISFLRKYIFSDAIIVAALRGFFSLIRIYCQAPVSAAAIVRAFAAALDTLSATAPILDPLSTIFFRTEDVVFAVRG